MRVVLQRVSRAVVRIDGSPVGSIGRGYCLLLGFTTEDTEHAEQRLRWMVDKIIGLRLFADDDGQMTRAGAERPRKSSFSRSLDEVGGGILVVSQFTLYGDARKGRRPSFTDAASPDIAIPLYERFVELLRERAPDAVETGVFGAMMEVELVNDGPVTLVLER